MGRLEQGLTGNICAAALDGLLGLGSVLVSVSARADPFQALSAAAMALVWNQLAAVTTPRFSTLDVAATCICAAAATSPNHAAVTQKKRPKPGLTWQVVNYGQWEGAPSFGPPLMKLVVIRELVGCRLLLVVAARGVSIMLCLSTTDTPLFLAPALEHGPAARGQPMKQTTAGRMLEPRRP